MIGARLAATQLRQHRPDEAAHTSLSLTGDLSSVASQRVYRVLGQIRAGWKPLRQHPAVIDADRFLASLTGPAAVVQATRHSNPVRAQRS